MVRDPYWLHAYWEVTPEAMRRAKQTLGDDWDGHRWILRVHVYPGGEPKTAAEHFDVALNPEARNWYLRVPHPDSAYEGSIGLLARGGSFYPIARSERVRTPGSDADTGSALHWEMRAETLEDLPFSGSLEAGALSSEAAGRVGASERARREAGLSSDSTGRPGGSPRFRFQADAELILYGATEPNARLTIQGKPVALRPDGTFTVRFQLPDGSQRIPCSATSADERFRSTIDLVVERRTDSRSEASEESEDIGG